MLVKNLMISLGFVLLQSVSVFAATAEDGAYKIDPDHSNIGFEVNHMGISLVVGRFDKFTGTVQFASKAASSVTVDIEMNSVNTKVAQRDTHIRSASFFDVANFPKASFKADKVTYDNDGNPASLEGTLTMHGQTKPVVLEVVSLGAGKAPSGEVRAGFKAKGTIKRSEFGMTQMISTVLDEVTLLLNVEAIKQ